MVPHFMCVCVALNKIVAGNLHFRNSLSWPRAAHFNLECWGMQAPPPPSQTIMFKEFVIQVKHTTKGIAHSMRSAYYVWFPYMMVEKGLSLINKQTTTAQRVGWWVNFKPFFFWNFEVKKKHLTRHLANTCVVLNRSASPPRPFPRWRHWRHSHSPHILDHQHRSHCMWQPRLHPHGVEYKKMGAIWCFSCCWIVHVFYVWTVCFPFERKTKARSLHFRDI